MGCGCQGSSDVFRPPTGNQAEQRAAVDQNERLRRSGPTMWTGRAQPPAQQKG
jgi:hypothetical protein